MEIVLSVAVILFCMVVWTGLFVGIAYVFALYEFCFTFVREGTAVAIMRGNTFDHFLMTYRGHYLNDPRRKQFDSTEPAWEVLQSLNSNERRSVYPRFSPWRLPERFGIYFYGLWPLRQVQEYRFRWSEEKIDPQSGAKSPWYRDKMTKIIFVSTFVYWVKLTAAEDTGNIPIDLDYLLSVRATNPYKARFTVTSWLDLLTADANSAARMWVGNNSFEQIVRERSMVGRATSGFSDAIGELNQNLPTFNATVGAGLAIGVTIVASSLQQVAIAGREESQAALLAATTAKTVAERQADARRATALGEADATRTLALGEADATKTRAKAERTRIKAVYTEVGKHGNTGLLVQQMDAVKAAATSPGSTVLWANSFVPAALARLFGHAPPTSNS